MDYEKLMEQVKNVTKDDMKRVVFEVDQDSVARIKAMKIDEDVKKELLEILKNRTFLDMLLVNALK